MASIHRNSDSRYWQAAYRGPDGHRLLRSTKHTDKSKALAMALEFERAAQLARSGQLVEAQAREVLKGIMARAGGAETLAFYTVESWFKAWLAGKEQARAEGTHTRYAHVVKAFLAHLGRRAQLNLQHISPKDIASFRDKEAAAGKSASTCNLAVKTVSSVLNAALRQGYIPSNPALALETLKHKAAEKGTFTSEQVEDLLAAATSPDWRGAILFTYYTGARLQDVANMRWLAVDLTRNLVCFKPMKTPEKQVVIPLHPALEEHLLSIAASDNAEAHLFPSLAGKKTGGAHGLSMRFSEIMDKAGTKAGAVRPQQAGGRAISYLSFHSLRHGFNSVMANGGVNQEIRQKLTGHSSPEMNKKYTHHELEPLRAAIKVLPSLKLK